MNTQERMPMHSKTVVVTPEIATMWLERNVVNRPVSERHVGALAWDMKNGKWELTHQGIAFNRDMLLIDGQHRLRAVVAAEVNVPMRVTCNVDGQYSSPIDMGYGRRVSHILGMTNRRVAIFNALALLETGAASKMTAAKVGASRDRHERAIEWAIETFPVQRRVNANVIAAHVFAFPTAPDLVEAFADKLTSGANIGVDSPVMVLRKHLARMTAGYTAATRLSLSLVTLRCLQAHCAGESLAKVCANDVGLSYFAKRRAEMGL